MEWYADKASFFFLYQVSEKLLGYLIVWVVFGGEVTSILIFKSLLNCLSQLKRSAGG